MPRLAKNAPTIEYRLHLESGPRRKKTMGHVLDLPGCIATGPDAYRRSAEMVAERVRAATDDQLSAVVQRPKDVRTLRKALRRTLEHPWEHLLELSRRPGGPAL